MGKPWCRWASPHFNGVKFTVVAALVAFTPDIQITLFQLDPGDSHHMVLFFPDGKMLNGPAGTYLPTFIACREAVGVPELDPGSKESLGVPDIQ